jgi:hypothetical protein
MMPTQSVSTAVDEGIDHRRHYDTDALPSVTVSTRDMPDLLTLGEPGG